MTERKAITRLLLEWRGGNAALDELVPLVYDERVGWRRVYAPA